MGNEEMNQGTENVYQQNVYQPVVENTVVTEEPIGFGEWMLTILLLSIPCVNIVMLLVWAFGGNVKKTKSNYAKAMLIWTIIGIIFTVISTFIVVAIGAGFAASAGSYYM